MKFLHITSTIAYIEFKPENRTGKSYGSQSIIDKNGKVQKLQQLDLKPVKQNKTENLSLTVSPEDNLLSLSLSWGGSDLDLHLYSPSGQHIGYNYTSNSTDLIANTTYTTTNTSESVSIQNPESGNWSILIYGRNVSQQYNETGEPYSLGISMVGDYKPNLTAGISAKTVTLNESASLPVSIRNIGSAIAYNLSAIFYSDSFNITENISLQSLEAGIGLSTEINALPLALGNATVYMNLTYYDSEGNKYNFSNSTIMQIISNPRLYIYLDYSPINPTTADTLKFNITLTNIGSSTAYRINLTTQLDSGINATSTNFSLANLPSGQSADFSFNAKASAGRFYARTYAYYENQNGSLFLAGSNEAEIKVSETTTTTLPSPPTTVPQIPPEVTTTTSTTTTLPLTTTTTTSLTTTTSTTQTTLTSTTITTTTTQIVPITSTTTTTSSTLPTTTQTTTTSTTLITKTTTTTLPDIHPPKILKSFSEIDGRKSILQLLTDEISICKYDIEDKPYDEMRNIFTETNGTVHRESLKLQKGTYTFYARCIDISENVDNSSVVFSFSINATTKEKVSALPVSEEIILCKPDGIRNYAETGVDCGGPCKPCETTTTVRTTTTTVKVTTTSLAIISTVTTTTIVTTTTLARAPDIVGRVIAFTGERSSGVVLFALIFALTAGLVYYLMKGGKKEQ